MEEKKFTGGDSLTGLTEHFHKIMMINELSGGKGAYKLSHAKHGRSGYSYGGNQMDLSVNKHGREILTDILRAHATKEDKINSIINTVKDKEKKLNAPDIVLINDLLMKDFAIKLINEAYVEEINSTLNHVKNILQSIKPELVKFRDQHPLILILADYHNQFHLSKNGPMHQVLNGNEGNFLKKFTLRTHEITTIKNLISQIREAINCTKWGSHDIGKADIKRRQKNIDDIIEQLLNREESIPEATNEDITTNDDHNNNDSQASNTTEQKNINKVILLAENDVQTYNLILSFFRPQYQIPINEVAVEGNKYFIKKSGKFYFKNHFIPFDKDKFHFDGIKLIFDVNENITKIISCQLSTTLCFFEYKEEIIIDLVNFYENLNKAFDTSRFSETDTQQFLLNNIPAIHFKAPGIVNSSDLLNPFLTSLNTIPELTEILSNHNKSIFLRSAIKTNFLGLPELKLDQLEFSNFQFTIDCSQGIVICQCAESNRDVTLGFFKDEKTCEFAIKIDDFDLFRGEFANIINNISFAYATNEIPMLGFSPDPTIYAKINLSESSITPIKVAAKYFGINYPVEAGIRYIDDENIDLTVKLVDKKLKINSIELTNVSLFYSTIKENLKVSGNAQLNFLGNNITGEGYIQFSSDGAIKGSVKIHENNEFKIKIFKASIYLSNLSIVVKKADDQGIKLGIDGDFCFEPKAQCENHEIGRFECLPGATIYNSDISVKFPRGFKLSLAHILNMLAGQKMPLCELLKQIEYSGYDQDGVFHPLTYTYLPSESKFQSTSQVNVYGYNCLQSNMLFSKSKSLIDVQFPKINILDLIKITNKDRSNGLLLRCQFVSLTTFKPARDTNILAKSDILLEYFGQQVLVAAIDAFFDNEFWWFEISTQLIFAKIIKTKNKVTIVIDIVEKCFDLDCDAGAQLSLKLKSKWGNFSVGSFTINILMRISSEHKEVYLECTFKVLSQHVSVIVTLPLNTFEANIHKLSEECQKEINKKINYFIEKDMRNYLRKLDPTNNPEVKKVLDNVNCEIKKQEEKSRRELANAERDARREIENFQRDTQRMLANLRVNSGRTVSTVRNDVTRETGNAVNNTRNEVRRAPGNIARGGKKIVTKIKKIKF